MNIKIRELKKEDFRNGFLESLSNLFKVGLTPEKAEKIYEQVGTNPFYHFLVAELGDQIVAVTTLLVEQKFLLDGARFGYIEDVATREGYERRGIGRKLQIAAIEEARKAGCCLIRLDCNEHNIPFYKKCGFHVKEGTSRMQIDLSTPSI